MFLNSRFTISLLSAGMICSGSFTSDSQAESTEPQTLTLMTYNIHTGVPMGKEIGHQKVGTEELDAIGKVISAVKPNVVALQEVDCEYGYSLPSARQRSSLINQARYLSQKTGLPYIFGSAQDEEKYPSDNGKYVEWGTPQHWFNNGMPHGEVGNALLLSAPFKTPPQNFLLPKDEGQERRAAVRAEVSLDPANHETPAVKAVIYAAHFQHNSAETRTKQMKALVERAKEDSHDSLVFILGDLNHDIKDGGTTNPIQFALDNGFHDLHFDYSSAKNTEPRNTFPADKPETRIDYILCNQPLKVISAGVPDSLASDHLPLVVTVELPKATRQLEN